MATKEGNSGSQSVQDFLDKEFGENLDELDDLLHLIEKKSRYQEILRSEVFAIQFRLLSFTACVKSYTFVRHRSTPHVQNIYASILFTRLIPYITSIFLLKYPGVQQTRDFCTPHACVVIPLDSGLIGFR